jgi:broad specificity phosphatase PhoE
MTAIVAAPRALGATDAPQTAWLVRHAPTAWTGRRWCGRSDPPLSREGREVAAEAAKRLAPDLPGDVTILSSPLRRARETGIAIANAAGRPVSVLPDLAEVDFGRIEGLTWAELSTLEPALAERILAREPVDWPGGEAALAVSGRAVRMATEIRNIGGPVVVVSHGRFLAALHAALVDGAGNTTEPTTFAPGSVFRVRLAGHEGNG